MRESGGASGTCIIIPIFINTIRDCLDLLVEFDYANSIKHPIPGLICIAGFISGLVVAWGSDISVYCCVFHRVHDNPTVTVLFEM